MFHKSGKIVLSSLSEKQNYHSLNVVNNIDVPGRVIRAHNKNILGENIGDTSDSLNILKVPIIKKSL